ncbi:hypothetical protein BWQ93_18630 [Sphingopyxis sp. QXT-31]|uniref:glycoside hydrolase domain-containing protein n=1 Tax=Sphingopyxis sp. QXT-31 TaxID=1357916 RepID=UPI000979225A|nr:glycoside hydrolase domain-containing protein [Sphingopyxis sp. QXT-31]AQA00248.1 hypothetical protein BWQ93_18630 [Sphingopyxis sp. QXT-31]
MNRLSFAAALVAAAFAIPTSAEEPAPDVLTYVDPTIGIGPEGHTFPAGQKAHLLLDLYVIGRPFVDRAVLNLPDGKKFTVETLGLSDANPYVGKVELNGKALTRGWIADAGIRKGGTLRFTMQSTPNAEWGKAATARPYSMSTAGQ